MSAVRYEPMHELAVTHSFFADGRCPDFDIEPDAETRRLLAGHRLLLSGGQNSVLVAAPIGDDGHPIVAIASGTMLGWVLRLRTPSFGLYTELSDHHRQKRAHYRPDPAGSSGASVTELELVERAFPDTVPPDTFATVETALDPAPTGDNGRLRRNLIDFTPTEQRWAYYCITGQTSDPDALTLIDTAITNPVGFDAEDRRDLVTDPDPADGIAADLAARHPLSRRLRFLSDRPIPDGERNPARIELRVDDRKVMGPLPSPALAPPTTATLVTNPDPGSGDQPQRTVVPVRARIIEFAIDSQRGAEE